MDNLEKRLVLADSHDRRYFLAAKALGDDGTASRLQSPGTFLLRVALPTRLARYVAS